MKRTLIVLGIIVGVAIIAFVGYPALFGGGTKQPDSAPGGSESPLQIKPGKAFSVGGFKYSSGWSVGPDASGRLEISGLKVTNKYDEKAEAVTEMKLWTGNQLLGSAECTTGQIDVGATAKVDCVSDDAFDGYQRITINDAS